jgi:glycosyltransferase involved in cell wall biosynthesis
LGHGVPGVSPLSTGTRLPRVTIVLATHRVDRIDECRRIVSSQDYPNLETIIVLNNDAFDEASVRNAFADVPSLQILRLPAARNLGSCVNLGVANATGSYIAKMDDDDFYGPSYISDLVLSALESGADITGKKATFFYFEDGEEYCLWHSGLHNRWLWPPTNEIPRGVSSKLAGATLFMKHEVVRELPFDESAPHGTDSLFQQACRRAGLTTFASDEFNFCYLRRASNAGHLWRTTKKDILENALLLPAFAREKVCV